MTIIPTVGRIMWFYPAEGSSHKPADGEPLSAQVASVFNHGKYVNIAYLDQSGNIHAETSVAVMQEGEDTPAGGRYVSWMPYQRAAAASSEAKAINQSIVDAERTA